MTTEETIKMENRDWTKFDTSKYDIATALEIIDDATVYHFEFKVENGQIYWRDIELATVPTV